MKEVKRRLLRILLVAEIIGLSSWYSIGSNGLYALRAAEKVNKQLAAQMHVLEKEIANLKEELEERQKTSFYKERIARQELQMAREDEEIYLLPCCAKVS